MTHRTLTPLQASDLPASIRKAITKLLEFEGQDREIVLLARLINLEAIYPADRQLLNLPVAVEVKIERFLIDENFDPAEPVGIIHRIEEAAFDPQALINNYVDENSVNWKVKQRTGNANDFGLPKDQFLILAELIDDLHSWEIEEWLSEDNGVPLGLSQDVAAIYAKYADDWSNDNIEIEPAYFSEVIVKQEKTNG